MDTIMGRRLRAFWLAALLIVASGGTVDSTNAEEAVPPLRANTELFQFYRMLPLVDFVPTPHSWLGTERPFKAIAFDLEVTPTFPVAAHDLSTYADAAMRARLAELGVEDQIRVLPSAWSSGDRPPDGLTHCDILHVQLLITSARMPVDTAEMDAAAISLFAWQDATDCLGGGKPAWALRASPRLILARSGDIASLAQQSRRHILALIDWELIEEVTRINADADLAFRAMLKVP